MITKRVARLLDLSRSCVPTLITIQIFIAVCSVRFLRFCDTVSLETYLRKLRDTFPIGSNMERKSSRNRGVCSLTVSVCRSLSESVGDFFYKINIFCQTAWLNLNVEYTLLGRLPFREKYWGINHFRSKMEKWKIRNLGEISWSFSSFQVPLICS